jgi:hypothetical protein
MHVSHCRCRYVLFIQTLKYVYLHIVDMVIIIHMAWDWMTLICVTITISSPWICVRGLSFGLLTHLNASGAGITTKGVYVHHSLDFEWIH